MLSRWSRGIETCLARCIDTRQYLHQHPELSGSEVATAALVAERLGAIGLQPRTGVGGHGVIADLYGVCKGRMLAIRADMDALPITEESGLPYASLAPGVMHACGHDGHTAILLAVAEILWSARSELRGSVRFIFQPAEETVGGATAMCADGAMDGVDAIVALHGWRHLPTGVVGVSAGPTMAAADVFDIRIEADGAHAAYPHLTADPIVAAASVIMGLQTIVSRTVDPLEPAVVTVARVEAGTAYNIIPSSAHLAGTVRTLSADVRALVPGHLQRICEAVSASSGATCVVDYKHGSPPVVNDPDITRLITASAEEALGAQCVTDLARPSMGAEDFSYYLQHAPGAMFRLGIGDGPAGHTACFDFNDGALGAGIAVLCTLAARYLSR